VEGGDAALVRCAPIRACFDEIGNDLTLHHPIPVGRVRATVGALRDERLGATALNCAAAATCSAGSPAETW
jgi:hypothetical protein